MVRVNSDCIGCRACSQICSSGFKMEGGKAVVIDENADCIQKAADACPTNAIVLNEEPEEGNIKQTDQHVDHSHEDHDHNLTGEGTGRGRGTGGGKGQGGGQGLGPGGNCVCPKCGYEEPHERGQPCYEKKCPECGTRMTRE